MPKWLRNAGLFAAFVVVATTLYGFAVMVVGGSRLLHILMWAVSSDYRRQFDWRGRMRIGHNLSDLEVGR